MESGQGNILQSGSDPSNARLKSLIHVSGLPIETMVSMRLDKFQLRKDVKGLEEALAFANSLACGDTTFSFLTLSGQTGLGKTHLAVGIGWDWLERYKYVVYGQVENLLDDLREKFERPEHELFELHIPTFSKRFDQLKTCDLLILDDFGAQKQTDWGLAKLDALVDYRYIRALATVVTTNSGKGNLPPRIADRLCDIRKGKVIVLEGPSYRGITPGRNGDMGG